MSGRKHRFPGIKRAADSQSLRQDVIRKGFLAAGALSSVLYVVATDGIAAARWDGYRRSEQMVSELFAVGPPAGMFSSPLHGSIPCCLRLFGVGVWNSARDNRALRAAGGLLVGYGLWNIVGGLYPLTLGDQTSVPMHIAATNIQLALMVAAMCFVAAGFHGRMRMYSIASLALSAVLGMVAFMAAPGPDLILGIGERVSIGAFLLWVTVLAVLLWKHPAVDGPLKD